MLVMNSVSCGDNSSLELIQKDEDFEFSSESQNDEDIKALKAEDFSHSEEELDQSIIGNDLVNQGIKLNESCNIEYMEGSDITFMSKFIKACNAYKNLKIPLMKR